MLSISARPLAGEDNAALRNQLSNLEALLVLAMLMTESGDERQILHLATTSVPSFGSCSAVVAAPS